MHHRLRAHLLERARTAAGNGVLPAMEAVKYLHRAGGVTPRFFVFSGDGGVFEDSLRPGDAPTVLRLAHEAEGPAAAAAVEFWLDRQPEAFHVHRDSATGDAVAFVAWLRLTEPVDAELKTDPVVAAAWQHTHRRGPVRTGEHIAVARFMVHPTAYQRPSPVMDLMMHRVLAGFIDVDRRAWSFVAFEDAAFWEPLMTYSDHHALQDEGEVALGDRSWTLFAHDWRSMPMDAWLEFTAQEELFGPQSRRATVVPEVAVLSRPEFDSEVRGALRMWHRTDALAKSPLIRSRLVTDQNSDDPVEVLRERLTDAVDQLSADPRDARLHRALAATFFHGATSQEQSAEQLRLPFSTYRRHLSRGLTRVADRLWELEHDAGAPGVKVD
ncbi:sigma-70 family RNA polymerase sigma factor [Streptomyces flaveus]|uniref:Uncharacterized protein n=1 Tax=Streptomyces flaveus TaxID=66370 RepID=A0A917VSH7_9ACTN|nr:sigma-70 family RNA polymerase sigma factor [Streptomyces flaveus]GGL09913.1 hypothetical protein GCM10010094_83450 [Streptomyces flaveus]